MHWTKTYLMRRVLVHVVMCVQIANTINTLDRLYLHALAAQQQKSPAEAESWWFRVHEASVLSSAERLEAPNYP